MICATVAIADMDAANALLDDLGHGPDNFKVLLRSGNSFATHAGLSHAADDTLFAMHLRGVATQIAVTFAEAPFAEVIGALEWSDPTLWAIDGNAVMIGDLRVSPTDGLTYESLIDFNVWAPPSPQWRIVVDEGLPPWQAGSYAVGEEVTHAGDDWISRRANNVWEPGTVQAGWLRTSPDPAPWIHVGNEGYPVLHPNTGEPMRVTHNGILWRNDSAGNFWEPGAALWINEGAA